MNKLTKISLIALATGFIFNSCNDSAMNKNRLKDGNWYAEFSVDNNVKIPFLFEVENADNDSLTTVILRNGDERVPLKGISYKDDTIRIPIEAYDSELWGVITGDTLKGKLKKLFDANDRGIDFLAFKGTHPRFQVNGSNDVSLAGKWDIQFINKSDTTNNVGVFKNTDGIITGSVLTKTGDLRFLEGVIDKDGFKLSAFGGLMPYLLSGVFSDNDHFVGEFITPKGIQKMVGTRNDNATLENTVNLTTLKEGKEKLGFKLKDIHGKEVSLSDSIFKDKVVIVSVLGSWCPNCLDEMAFLAPWYKENKERGVEVVGVSFERKNDPDYIYKVLNNLINKYDTVYPILSGGKIGDESQVFPELTQLKGYPTTIFIDKKGKVREIHTGFNGPATGLFYDEFKTDFNNLVNSLLAE